MASKTKKTEIAKVNQASVDAAKQAVLTETRPATYHLLNDFGLYKNSLRRKLDMDDLEYYFNRDGNNPEVAQLPVLLHQHKGFEYTLPEVELLSKYLIYTWEDDLVLKTGTLADGITKAPNIRKHFAKLCLKDYERVQGEIAKFKKSPRPDVTVEVKAPKAPKAKAPKAPAAPKAPKAPKYELPATVKEAAMQYADANVQWKSRRFNKLVKSIKEAGFDNYEDVLDFMGVVAPSEPPVKADPTKEVKDLVHKGEEGYVEGLSDLLKL